MKNNDKKLNRSNTTKPNWLNVCFIGHPRSGKTMLFNYILMKQHYYYSNNYQLINQRTIQEELASCFTFENTKLMIIDTPGATKYTKSFVRLSFGFLSSNCFTIL